MIKDEWKGIGVVVVLVSLLAAAVVPFVMASTDVPITCTVTAGTYSVSLDRSEVNYGSMAEGTSKVDPDGAINATNDAGMTQDLLIRGTNATNDFYIPAATWTLAEAPGVDVYKHTYNTSGGEQNLSASDNNMLANDLADGYSQEFTLKLYTPTTITQTGTYNVDVYVVATSPV
jgi:hypothetical protein